MDYFIVLFKVVSDGKQWVQECDHSYFSWMPKFPVPYLNPPPPTPKNSSLLENGVFTKM